MKFKEVKVGDKVLVKRQQYGDPQYFTGTVSKVTATRFTLTAACFSDDGQTFTNDGDVYPREKGYGRTFVHIYAWNVESAGLVKKTQLANKIGRLASDLSSLMGSSATRNRMTDLDLSNDELDTTLKMLEDITNQLMKYKRD